MGTNGEKFQVLRGTLISLMDIRQARTESTQDEMKAKMDIHQEKMEVAIQSNWFEVEDSVKYRVEDVLSCIHQNVQGLHKEPTQVDLQAMRMSIDTRTKSLLKTMMDTREHIQEELGFMIQVETQITRTLIYTMQRGLEANIAEVKTRA
jgi:hypothetical protein